MLERIDELIEIAKIYMEKGYDVMEAIKLAEKKIQEIYFKNWGHYKIW